MIVPYTITGESIKAQLDKDQYRSAINQLMTEFESYQYNFVDYIEWLETLEPAVRTRMVGIDAITQEVRRAPADIFIYMELEWSKLEADESQLSIQLWANDKYSAQRYATSERLLSSRRRWQIFAQPLAEIFRDWEKPKILAFHQKLDEKLKQVLINGRNIRVEIGRSERSKIPVLAPAIKQQVGDYLKSFALNQATNEVGGGPDLWIFEFKILVQQHSPGELGGKLASFLENKLPIGTRITPMYRSAQINLLIE